MYRNVVVYFHHTFSVSRKRRLKCIQSLGVPLKQFQEAATEMCSAKKVFWEFQAKFFKSTRD